MPKYGLNFYKLSHARMFSRPKILFLVSLLFVALLNSIPTYLLNFLIFYHSLRNSDSSSKLVLHHLHTLVHLVRLAARFHAYKAANPPLRKADHLSLTIGYMVCG